MSSFIRRLAFSIIVSGSAILVLGVLLYQAAFTTNATSDYTISVSWFSTLASTLWPPSRLPVFLLLSVVLTSAVTGFVFFRIRRAIAFLLLLIEAGVVYWFGGWLGWFFLSREFTHYHFSMDGEKLGENWFTFESLGVWSAAVGALALIRLIARRPKAEEARA